MLPVPGAPLAGTGMCGLTAGCSLQPSGERRPGDDGLRAETRGPPRQTVFSAGGISFQEAAINSLGGGLPQQGSVIK